MIRTVSLASLAIFGLSFSATAQVDEDEIVRLPGQGEVRSSDLRERAKAEVTAARGEDYVYESLLGDRDPPLDYRR